MLPLEENLLKNLIKNLVISTATLMIAKAGTKKPLRP